jgi:riboflavin kinase/FMN adenylyltransferase
MKVISLNGRSKLHLKKTCIAIGIFDGVHRGHQYLIKKMLATARRLGAAPVIITFFPHPAHVLRPDLKIGYLTSLAERFSRLGKLGVADCLVVRFNRPFANIEPQKFIQDILVKKLGVKAVFVGENFRFGKDRNGNAALFKKLAPEYGYQVHAVSSLKQGRVVISSTRIRQLIGAGKLKEAARLLGRAVSVSGAVVKGSMRGRSLGYPTANVAYEADIIPPQGVYVVMAKLGKKEYPAIANIGTRPSFEKQVSKLYLEVHILDFSKDIYGKRMEVEFLKNIRSEKKFSNPRQLIRQIRKDETYARKYFR